MRVLNCVNGDPRQSIKLSVGERNTTLEFDTAGEGAGEAFGKLSEAADAVQRLADFLERNPNALLTGKKAPR